jgi:AhpD family alkylhydroperoxidase
MYYHEHDLKGIGKLKALAPEDFTAWLNLDKIVSRTDGKIPRKYRELIAVAVAHTTQCPYCIEVHSKGARKAGASKEELAEAIFVAAAIRSSGAAAHGSMALRFFEEAEQP